jgi:hypothetical protein
VDALLEGGELGLDRLDVERLDLAWLLDGETGIGRAAGVGRGVRERLERFSLRITGLSPECSSSVRCDTSQARSRKPAETGLIRDRAA